MRVVKAACKVICAAFKGFFDATKPALLMVMVGFLLGSGIGLGFFMTTNFGAGSSLFNKALVVQVIDLGDRDER